MRRRLWVVRERPEEDEDKDGDAGIFLTEEVVVEKRVLPWWALLCRTEAGGDEHGEGEGEGVNRSLGDEGAGGDGGAKLE